jgi:hypothetical protein
MATAAKFVQPIPIFLAYLVPLAVDVVPIKFMAILVITSPRTQLGDVLLFYVSFSLILLFLLLLLFFHTFLSALFLGDAGFHGNFILNFINTPKASTHYDEYSYDVS